ncbi:acyltransferase [Aquimarina sp. U1-2]|uniref:acyltransferase family protein n=1 Tax=Aquimarina sp. U1-2 TaxID=2823141 RepID=UPI001AECD7B0|nr:acyltransferase family protein [Aquimarina sp. U1-2]MBP2831397.1 acyltransferase [Aquimarina sp. U1-2]
MNKTLFYRADIDGLRAIAVILVILYHADLSWIEGGYIGVDVFFVISGYLITSSINKEMLNGAFSFKAFYLRRIRRIIPVLVFVMLVVTLPACLFLFANDLENFSRTVLHTMLSTNNFYLWLNGKNYFVENTEVIPLLHTWSLAVEEQFYVIWPPILLLMHRFLHSTKRLVCIVLCIIAGLGISVYQAYYDPTTAYFLLPARLFELSMGAGLALFWDKIPKISTLYNHIISSIGLLLIISSGVLLDNSSIFPGMNALWPCLGAVMIILAGKSQDNALVNRLLAMKPLVTLGLLSYSMYLWHWPIFVFIKYLGYDLDVPKIISAITLTIVLSYFSWKYVEQPFRYRFTYRFSKTIWVVLLPCLFITGTIYGILDAKDGFPERHPELTEFNKDENFPNKVRKHCFDTYAIGNVAYCSLGVKKDTLDGILIGDSFANHTAAFIDVLAKDANLYFHDSAAGGYPLLHDIDDISGENERDPRYGLERLAYAQKLETIIIATNWERFYDPASKNYQFVLETLAGLVESKKNIIIIDPLRATSAMNIHKMKMYKTKGNASILKKDILIPFYERPETYIVYEIQRKFPSVTVINLNDVMCDAQFCEFEINGSIIYRNGNHLNTSGAELIARRFIEEKGNPLHFLKK